MICDHACFLIYTNVSASNKYIEHILEEDTTIK